MVYVIRNVCSDFCIYNQFGGSCGCNVFCLY